MKYIFIFLFFFLFSACKSLEKVSYSGEKYEISNPLSHFLKQFELATVNHNKAKLLTLLDRLYKSSHYDILISTHDKEHFFRVLFCGKDINTDQSVCPAFNEVVYIDFISIHKNDNGTYKIRYRVHTIYEVLVSEWIITSTERNNIVVLGIKASFC